MQDSGHTSFGLIALDGPCLHVHVLPSALKQFRLARARVDKQRHKDAKPSVAHRQRTGFECMYDLDGDLNAPNVFGETLSAKGGASEALWAQTLLLGPSIART
jgi:hypothetical protein